MTRKILRPLILFCAAYLGVLAQAVPVGPNINEVKQPEPANAIGPAKPRLDIPGLDIAVVVLNPNLDENDDGMQAKGIWPEVRKAESMRSACRIKEALVRLNQFDTVAVVPAPIVSADLYLRGKIERSTSEIMEIRWNLMDARGVNWINWKTSDHRVALGWHQRHYTPGKDAFQPLWNEIANDVYAELKKYAQNHASTAKDNEKRLRQNKAPKLSRLEHITHVRDLVLASSLAPQLYRDTLKENRKSQWEIAYLPDTNSDEWLRVQAFARLDEKVTGLYDTQYVQFFNQVNPSYEQWLNDVYPYAREARLEKRRATRNKIVGGVILAASVAAAVDAPNPGAVEDALLVGGLVGGGLIFKGLMDSKDFKQNLGYFDELTEDYHDSFKPTNLQVEGHTLELTGTATTQLTDWRNMLIDLYNIEQTEASDIRIIEN